jgi:molecular chaperone DnaK
VSYWLGIDAGTTFTAAAICRAQAQRRALPEMVPLGTRCTAVSSVLYLAPDGQVVVGEAAERRAVTDPERVVREFKRRIGDEVPMVIGGLPHSPPEIAAKVLCWVIDRVAQREGGPASGIAITHPASWGTYKIQTLARALRAPGLPEISFCTEPEAAAASYALQERIESGSTIAVYDLGGGTFDAAVVRKTSASTFSVLGQPQGLDHLGGADFDDAIVNHVLAAVPALVELDPTDPTTLAATAALRRECIDAKEALSADTEVTIPVLAPGIHAQVRLVRSEFEDMIRPQVTQTIEALHQALRSAGLTAQDLDVVLLVGGSSRVPLVAQLVSAELGRPVAIDADPKAAIALGAALFALPPDTPAADTTAAELAGETRVRSDAIPAPSPVATESTASGPTASGFAPPQTPQRPTLTAIPLDLNAARLHARQASSRRATWVALAGVLALITVAGVASVLFLTSRGAPLPQADAGTPAPRSPLAPRAPLGAAAPSAPSDPGTAAASPAANAASGATSDKSSGGEGSAGHLRTAPPAAPNKPGRLASGAVTPGPATIPSGMPEPTSVTRYAWPTSWFSLPPSHNPPPQPTPTVTTTGPVPTPTPTTKTTPTAKTSPTTTTAAPKAVPTAPTTTISRPQGSHP